MVRLRCVEISVIGRTVSTADAQLGEEKVLVRWDLLNQHRLLNIPQVGLALPCSCRGEKIPITFEDMRFGVV